MIENQASNFITALAGNGGSVSPTATSWHVAANLPSGLVAPFRAIVYANDQATVGEVVIVGAATGTAWSSITRGQETNLGNNLPAQTWSDGALVAVVVTGEQIQAIAAAVNVLGSAANQPTSAFDAAGAAAAETTRAQAAEALLAPKASPAFTGAPTAPTPTTANGIATKAYVDALSAGLSPKNAVKASAATNQALSGLPLLESYQTVDGDRILLIGQTTSSQDGIWQVHSGAWTRPADFASGSSQQGTYTFDEATGAGYVMTGDAPVTVDTTGQTWTKFTGGSPGAAFVQVNAGTAPEIDAATALTDQFALVYDQASGLWKGKSFVQLPTGAAAGDLFEYNGTGLVRIPGDTAGKVLTSQGPAVAPNWQTPSGGGGGGTPVQTPAYDGMLAENAPHWLASIVSNNQIQAFGGELVLLKVQVPSALATVTNICIGVGIAGSGLTAAQNLMGIYNAAGTLLGQTGDLTTAWGSAGPVVAPIAGGPIAVPAGFVFVAVLANGSGMPSFRSIGQQAATVNDLLTPATYAVGSQGNGHTSLPSSLTLSSSTSDNRCWWVGLS